MHRQQLRKKPSRPNSSSFTRRAARPSTSYLKTRIRGSRLQNATRILALVELTRRLHQSYRFAYDKQAADRLLPQNTSSPQQPDGAACDKKLAGIFGGPGALVGSARDPLTVGSNPNALAYAQKYGLPTDRIGERLPGHGPAPYDNPDPTSSDKGGIIHIYGNDNGTATGTGLYTPAGGSVGGMVTRHAGTANAYTQINVNYNRGSYAGLTIAFVHVSAGSGGTNAMGSVRIGNIGGLGSIDSPNYIHTHAVFYMKGARVDPRTIFCKEFGF